VIQAKGFHVTSVSIIFRRPEVDRTCKSQTLGSGVFTMLSSCSLFFFLLSLMPFWLGLSVSLSLSFSVALCAHVRTPPLPIHCSHFLSTIIEPNVLSDAWLVGGAVFRMRALPQCTTKSMMYGPSSAEVAWHL